MEGCRQAPTKTCRNIVSIDGKEHTAWSTCKTHTKTNKNCTPKTMQRASVEQTCCFCPLCDCESAFCLNYRSALWILSTTHMLCSGKQTYKDLQQQLADLRASAKPLKTKTLNICFPIRALQTEFICVGLIRRKNMLLLH